MHAIIRTSILVALFAALPGPALAQDISGTWKAVVELDVGSGEPTFVFKAGGRADYRHVRRSQPDGHRHGRHDRVLFRRTDGQYGHLNRDDQRRHDEGHLRLRTPLGGGTWEAERVK